jgi:hypothetical protein
MTTMQSCLKPVALAIATQQSDPTMFRQMMMNALETYLHNKDHESTTEFTTESTTKFTTEPGMEPGIDLLRETEVHQLVRMHVPLCTHHPSKQCQVIGDILVSMGVLRMWLAKGSDHQSMLWGYLASYVLVLQYLLPGITTTGHEWVAFATSLVAFVLLEVGAWMDSYDTTPWILVQCQQTLVDLFRIGARPCMITPLIEYRSSLLGLSMLMQLVPQALSESLVSRLTNQVYQQLEEYESAFGEQARIQLAGLVRLGLYRPIRELSKLMATLLTIQVRTGDQSIQELLWLVSYAHPKNAPKALTEAELWCPMNLRGPVKRLCLQLKKDAPSVYGLTSVSKTQETINSLWTIGPHRFDVDCLALQTKSPKLTGMINQDPEHFDLFVIIVLSLYGACRLDIDPTYPRVCLNPMYLILKPGVVSRTIKINLSDLQQLLLKSIQLQHTDLVISYLDMLHIQCPYILRHPHYIHLLFDFTLIVYPFVGPYVRVAVMYCHAYALRLKSERSLVYKSALMAWMHQSRGISEPHLPAWMDRSKIEAFEF